MSSADPKGYYAILEVAANAPAVSIKAAYRRRAMELHPDRNKSPNATAQFQLLALAFSHLSNSKHRAAYDAQSAIAQRETRFSKARSVPQPIRCSVCEKVTAQPRYVVFWEIMSFIVFSSRTPLQGIMCPGCAEKKAFRATGVTWLLGWWGIPLGPVFSIPAILTNLFGGEKPALVNARILTHQAIVFALRGQLPIAIGIARKAKEFAKKVHKGEPLRAKLDAELDKIIKLSTARTPTMINGWHLFRRPFYAQAALIAVLAASMFLYVQYGHREHPHYSSMQNAVNQRL
jgi:hypothetical protein